MIERIVVEYLREDKWFFRRDFPLGVDGEAEAKEYARYLWRKGVAGVRISKFERAVLLEHKRTS